MPPFPSRRIRMKDGSYKRDHLHIGPGGIRCPCCCANDKGAQRRRSKDNRRAAKKAVREAISG